ncbi:hypothetical protein ACFU99_20270 [Streptomyces sp. NPDC057654]|uniref:hypothetical protein n=1 Tax=Streptomyces sp. NPDC057654 TaxID=3346196 RepID=UPI0036874C7D
MRSAALHGNGLSVLAHTLPVPLWNSALAAKIYGRTLDVVCFRRGDRPVGIWVCPLDGGAEAPAAQRPYRLLPYASPWVAPELHPLDRHRVIVSMTTTLIDHVDSVELPMDPHFGEAAALIEAGAVALCRHTRMLAPRSGGGFRAAYAPTVRNHIRAAEKRHTVARVRPEEFDFSRAIVGQHTAAVAARRESGIAVSRDSAALCLAAVDDQGVCRGQVFVLRSTAMAILMHSWFDSSGTRGVPSLLVDRAIVTTVAEWGVTAFDFEGSVLPTVDRFMAGFGARAVAYPHIRWQRSDPSPFPEREWG